MNWLITGGTGFIGQNLVNLLTSKNESFTIIDKKSRGNEDVNIDNITSPIVADPSDVFVHLAAETSVRESISDPKKVYLDNVKGTINCLEFAQDNDIQSFIFASSASAPLSSSPYLASKLSCESLCSAYHKSYGLNISIMRMSNVYGPHSLHKDSVIHKMIKCCIDHQSVTIYGAGNQQRDFVYVEDVVKSFYNHQLNGISHLSTGELTTIANLVSMISDLSREMIDFIPKVTYLPPIKGEVYIPEVTRGIRNYTELKVGLYKTFKWYMENYAS